MIQADTTRRAIARRVVVSSSDVSRSILTESQVLSVWIDQVKNEFLEWAREHRLDPQSPLKGDFEVEVQVRPVKIGNDDE